MIHSRQKREVLDITGRVQEQLARAGPVTGICHLYLLHTTACLTVADMDPGTDLDYLQALEALMPQLRYRHPHNPAHLPDHLLSAVIGTSLTLPVAGGRAVLGTWQRVVLIELDGPRERELALTVIQEQGQTRR